MSDDLYIQKKGGYKELDHLDLSFLLHFTDDMGKQTKLIIFICPGKTKYLSDSELVNNGLFYAYVVGWLNQALFLPWPLNRSR